VNLTDKQFLVLGMVGHTPYDKIGISGTVLNRLIIERNVKEWARLSFSSAYYVLNQLEKNGLLKSKKDETSIAGQQEAGAPRKLFTVTTKGKRVLKKTTMEYFSRDNLNYKEMNLALAAAYSLTDREFLKVLQSHRKSLIARINRVKGKYDEDRNGEIDEKLPLHVWGLFNYAFYTMNARKEFIDLMISKLEKKIETKMK